MKTKFNFIANDWSGLRTIVERLTTKSLQKTMLLKCSKRNS